jgi:transcriptional regulator with XRE-family HTH domain
MTPGERLRKARTAAGVSTKELGEKAAVVMGRPRPLSPSAIRNQENGTNGIPLIALLAYAAILNVPKEWLLGLDEEYDSTLKQIELTNLTISMIGSLSAEWTEAALPANPTWEPNLFLRLPDFENTSLVAYEVIDRTLEPHYPINSAIVCMRVEEMGLRSGDHVVVGGLEDDAATIRLMEIRRSAFSVDLHSLNPRRPQKITLLRHGEIDPFDQIALIESVVVASLRRPTPGTGPQIRLPDQSFITARAEAKEPNPT